ncbi:mitochondrial phosphate carrier protein 2 [Uncinocarpus reesii 1704]|uniref:Mitochondrial phosphate carrier protein 2 n=1 Tax=Uncinocarpus reesii (strain UAMH 1704) TaxID=336963 RepID=C4JZL9_UNCRE|nr:mitochondrial phosphate carrier protein 2 [Uncinocarpus reesii 1704]EEP82755.1 mitochondrial phosphate carrier protein 2 [Uncinocarpus reesii 1704]
MSSLFPSQQALASAFASRYGLHQERKPTEPAPAPKQRRLFPAWSAIDDVKHKAEAVGHAAAQEFDKASTQGPIKDWQNRVAQGAFKYGGYEFFKKFYADLLGEDAATAWRTSIYAAASASAELIADVALCPFEAVKVRMQTTIPPFATGTFSGISYVVGKEGVGGLYKGLYPLWGRQIPYTVMKFVSFERIVEMIYNRLPGKKSDYNKGAQTAVAFTGGYLAGILCAVVSHPADVMVSKLNANRQPGEAFGAAMGRIYKDIGFGGLWNGLPVRIVMIGTLTGLQWMIYDSFKIFMGLPTTGGPKEAKKSEV